MKEIIGDLLLIAFGIILLYIFVSIEMLGIYGVESNKFIRWFELFMGGLILALGIDRLLHDMGKKR